MANRRILMITCGLMAMVLAYTAFRGVGILETWRLSRMHEKIESDNLRLIEDNMRLKDEVKDLLYNEKRIEAEARKIGLMYPDEVVICWKRDNGTTARMFVRPANHGKSSPATFRGK